MATPSAELQLVVSEECPVADIGSRRRDDLLSSAQIVCAVVGGFVGLAFAALFIGAVLQMAGIWTP